MEPSHSVDLDTACLQHVFSFLSRNHLVLSVKPLSKQFKNSVSRTEQGDATKITASDDVPPWALPILGLASLTYKQKKQLMEAAAKGGHLSTLQWARQQGCPWDRASSDAAAEGSHLAVLQWLRQEGCPWGPSTCAAAARAGHLEVLKWALKNGCASTRDVCRAAAESGKLELLQCARSHGCEWDASTCAAAAGSGDLCMLQWARDRECPWDGSTCSSAAGGGHLHFARGAVGIVLSASARHYSGMQEYRNCNDFLASSPA